MSSVTVQEIIDAVTASKGKAPYYEIKNKAVVKLICDNHGTVEWSDLDAVHTFFKSNTQGRYGGEPKNSAVSDKMKIMNDIFGNIPEDLLQKFKGMSKEVFQQTRSTVGKRRAEIEKPAKELRYKKAKEASIKITLEEYLGFLDAAEKEIEDMITDLTWRENLAEIKKFQKLLLALLYGHLPNIRTLYQSILVLGWNDTSNFLLVAHDGMQFVYTRHKMWEKYGTVTHSIEKESIIYRAVMTLRQISLDRHVNYLFYNFGEKKSYEVDQMRNLVVSAHAALKLTPSQLRIIDESRDEKDTEAFCTWNARKLQRGHCLSQALGYVRQIE